MEFSLPPSTIFWKIFPKNKILEAFQKTGKSGITDLRGELSENIEKIIWKHKIAKSTLGILPSENILEIHIFEIFLKNKSIPNHILKTIDILSPHPILYVLRYENDFHKDFLFAISLKKSGAENMRHKYLLSGWNEYIDFNFSAITTDELYENICKKILEKNNSHNNFQKDFRENISLSSWEQEGWKVEEKNFQKIVENYDYKNKLTKEIETLKNKMKKEKNLAKRNEIHLQIQAKIQELKKIA